MTITPEHLDPVVDIRNLRVYHENGTDRRTIVSDLNIEVAAGQSVAIVGESGSGKSMTAKALTGLLPDSVRAEGIALFEGRDVLGLREHQLRRIRGTRLGLVLQDPFTMLNPLMRCGDLITESMRARGMRRRARHDEAVRRLAEVGIHDPAVADRYPFQLSGGMRQRVGIAAALAGDPELLIADEPSTALDVTTQKEMLDLLRRLQHTRGMALILITHDLRVAFSMCSRVYVMYAGAVLESAGAASIESEPRHPYTLGLLGAEPPVDRRLPKLTAIPGSVPRPDDVADRCGFADRCAWVKPICTSAAPPLRTLAGGGQSACARTAEIRTEMRNARGYLEVSEVTEHTPATAPGDDRPLIQVSSLSKTYRSGRGSKGLEVVALREASIQVHAGECVGLVGESGSGKTTLGRCLVGLEVPTSGRIVVDDVLVEQFATLNRTERAHVRRTVQMVFQDPYSSLNPAITVGQTLREALNAFQDSPGDNDLRKLLDRVGLPVSYATQRPAALSGGERQRVAIARAIATGARVLVCDEPVSALDVSVQAQVLNLLNDLRRDLGLALLFITHDLAVVRQVADRLYVLYHGEIVEDGAAAAVLDNPQHPYTKRLLDSVLVSTASHDHRAASQEGNS